jgi:hypothetical protein
VNGSWTSASLNGGVSNLRDYNSNPSGDLQDWAGTTPYTPDAFNNISFSGYKNGLTAVDLTAIDVIGTRPCPSPRRGCWPWREQRCARKGGGAVASLRGKCRSRNGAHLSLQPVAEAVHGEEMGGLDVRSRKGLHWVRSDRRGMR